MAYGYSRPDPMKLFRDSCRHYRTLVNIAVSEGFTEEQAIELIKINKLEDIEDSLGVMAEREY